MPSSIRLWTPSRLWLSAVKSVNPFADPEELAPAPAPAPAPAGQRLSVASGVSVLSGDVQVSVGYSRGVMCLADTHASRL